MVFEREPSRPWTMPESCIEEEEIDNTPDTAPQDPVVVEPTQPEDEPLPPEIEI